MTATVLERPHALPRIRRSLAALAATLALGLALWGVAAPLATGTPPAPLADAAQPRAPGPLQADAAPADAGLDAGLAPVAERPHRPARRHRQPLAMPFFSFAVRS